jgi:Fe-S cluster assembly ATP-binding protein
MPLLKGDAVGMLELRDVRLELGGKAVLSGLSVDFWQGHIHALVGLNGAGKSTLASVLMGLPDYTHCEGEIIHEGESLRGVSVDERRVAASRSRGRSRRVSRACA